MKDDLTFRVIGNLDYIDRKSLDDFPAVISEISGFFSARNATSIEFPQLVSVGRNLYAESVTNIKFPQLSSVGEYFYAGSATTIECPQLASVGEFFSAVNATNIECPQLQTIEGNVYIDRNNEKIMALAQKWKEDGVLQGKIIEQ